MLRVREWTYKGWREAFYLPQSFKRTVGGMSLKPYQDKRNFTQTPEPRGKHKRQRAKKLRFVVQLHDASRRHYDLRLELDGVMKSWAVPKGPSLDPLEQRLAVAVEDHPLDYNDFEGVIPEGNYGAGVVMIWDEGSYTARQLKKGDDNDADAIRRGLADGHVTVVLSGHKLKGEFALVRLPKGGANSWLLLKKRDEFAQRTDVTHLDRSVRSGRTMGEIAVLNNLYRPKPPRASTPAGEPSDRRKKAGQPATKAKPRRQAALQRQPLSSGIMKKATEAPCPRVPLWPWPLSRAVVPVGQDVCLQPYHEGYQCMLLVDAQGQVRLTGRGGLRLDAKMPELCASLARLGGPLLLRGLVLRVDAEGLPLRLGSRSIGNRRWQFWAYDLLYADGYDLRELPLTLRLKALVDLQLQSSDVKIVASLGSTSTQAPAGDVLVRDSKSFYAAPTIGKIHKIRGTKRQGERPTAALLGSKRQALVQTPTTSQSTRPGGRRVASASEPDATLLVQSKVAHAEPRVHISNPQKIYWPDEGYTKGDLLAYYQAVARYMVPHLQGRPQSLHRHPHGIKGKSFFQKEVAGQLPGWMGTATIQSERSGKAVTYALINRPDDLLQLANMGCIEFNSWLSRIPKPAVPDQIVFDLDPGLRVSFAEVVKVALSVKRVLDMIGAKSYCKTSGGRGLHVYLPVQGVPDFAAARDFALGVAMVVHQLHPQTTSLERSPDKRRHQIYIDYLQNRFGQTTAAVYCVRPRPGALVSAPLKWSEVREGLDPSAYSIRTMPLRLKRLGDVWKGMLQGHNDFGKLQARLAKLASAED